MCQFGCLHILITDQGREDLLIDFKLTTGFQVVTPSGISEYYSSSYILKTNKHEILINFASSEYLLEKEEEERMTI